MHRLLFLLGVAGLAEFGIRPVFAGAPAPVRIRVAATARNLAPNPHFETGNGAEPAGWHFTTAIPENFTTAWAAGGRSGRCLEVRAKTGRMSGYWNARVPLVPGQRYRFSGWYRILGGRILCYAHARRRLPQEHRTIRLDERFYAGSFRQHWLAPVFLPPDALPGPKPDQWLPFQIVFRAPERLTAAEISLGIYFTPGHVFFDDVYFGPAETGLTVTATARRGRRIRRVLLLKTGRAGVIADSGNLAPPRRECTLTADKVETGAPLRIRVTLDSGQTIEKTGTWP